VPYQSFCIFCKAGGEFGGEGNQAYHPAADLVEKFRIAQGKAKSKKRMALEEEMKSGRGGRDGQPFLGVNPDQKFLCLASSRPVKAKDELGRTVVKFL